MKNTIKTMLLAFSMMAGLFANSQKICTAAVDTNYYATNSVVIDLGRRMGGEKILTCGNIFLPGFGVWWRKILWRPPFGAGFYGGGLNARPGDPVGRADFQDLKNERR